MKISLLCTINSNYRIPFQVLARSLVQHKQRSSTIEWHVFTDETGGNWREWIGELNRTYVETSTAFVLHRTTGIIHEKTARRSRAEPIMYARLAAPNSLERHTPRLVYLDADMLMLGPIEDLWKIDLGSHVCACSQDMVVPTVSFKMGVRNARALGIDPQRPYFNAGVMLIDTAKWCKNEIAAKALDYLRTYDEDVNLFDQEALNVAVDGNWLPLSYRWNLIASVAGRPFLDRRHLNQRDYNASIHDPCVIHYAGLFKPWLNPFIHGKWYTLYRRALRQALPDYTFTNRPVYRLQSAYDRYLRRLAYPLERFVWTTLRGF